MKQLLFLLLIGLQFNILIAEDEPVKVDKLHHKVAIMAYHEPREPVFYNDMRKLLYESYSLRLLRGIHRWTGFALDKGTSLFQILGGCCIFLITFSIFLGFIYKRKRLWFAILAFLGFIHFVLLIYIFSGVASLNQHDMKDPLHTQSLMDVFVMRGIEFDVHWDWKAFKKKWDESEGQAYQAVVWTGIPLGGDEVQIEDWLRVTKDVDLMHVCLGAHLPAMFHPALFQEKKAELSWNTDSSESICERPSAYERHTSWHEVGKEPVSGLFNGEGYQVLYLPTTLKAEDIDRIWLNVVNQSSKWLPFYMTWDKTVALRMDDPGGAAGAHLEAWRMPALSVKEWTQVESILEENDAKLSVAYVPGWLDDADSSRGELYHLGNKISEREAGKIYPSHEIRYEHKVEGWYELTAQADFLRESDRIETELHGLTHISPHIKDWLGASNQDSEADWFREFLKTETRPFQQRERDVQTSLLEKAQAFHLQAFERKAKLLVPPGHAISWDTAEVAIEKGLWGICGSSLLVSKGGIPRRSRLIHSFDLNKIKTDELAQKSYAYPSVAVMHDYDIHRDSPTWLAEKLKAMDVPNYISVRELMAKVKFTPELMVDYEKGLVELKFPAINLDPLPENWTQTFYMSPPKGWGWKNGVAQNKIVGNELVVKMTQHPRSIIFEMDRQL